MKRFPGTIERGGKNHREVILNEEQEAWLVRWFPVTENKRLAKAMGVSMEAMRNYANRLGVKGKSEAGMAAIRKRQGKAAAKTNERNGCYERKRGKPVSEATRAGLLKRWQDVREGRRLSPMEELKQRDPKAYAENMRLKSELRKEMIRNEQRRMLYGMERKTKLKVVVLKPYTQSQTHHRHSALQRGYLLDTDCSEGQPGRYVIYYDDETQRSARFEANCIKDGFTFKRDE
jgi:hypothetical protein